MNRIRREERVLNLLSVLIDAPAPLSFAKIRDLVPGYEDGAPDAIEKRFDRDKADLKKLGAPVEYLLEDGERPAGYRIRPERFFLDEIAFTPEEGIVLAALQRTAADSATGAFGESLRSALAKISVDSPLSDAFRESVAEQQALDPRLPAAAGAEAEALAVLADALAARRPVQFPYYTLHTGEEAVRTVEPWGVGFFGGQWYFVGRDRERGEERVFRTSRIRGPVAALPAAEYEIPADFDLAARIGRPAWQIGGGRRFRARIRFSAEIAWMIAENVRPGQTWRPLPDGGGELVVPGTDEEALVRWVAQYGALAEIAAPKRLRARMAEHLDRLSARYGE